MNNVPQIIAFVLLKDALLGIIISCRFLFDSADKRGCQQ